MFNFYFRINSHLHHPITSKYHHILKPCRFFEIQQKNPFVDFLLSLLRNIKDFIRANICPKYLQVIFVEQFEGKKLNIKLECFSLRVHQLPFGFLGQNVERAELLK